LQVLRLQNDKLSHLRGALLISGWQLLVLKFVRLIGVDVKVVGEKFHVLRISY